MSTRSPPPHVRDETATGERPSAPAASPRSDAVRAGPRTDRSTVLRFDATERLYHWVQAVPYLACAGTGAAMLLLADGAHATLRRDLGAVHRWAGALLLVGIAAVVAFGQRRVLFENARIAMSWTRDDFRWLRTYPLHEFGFAVDVPRVGKFNAGQKLNLLAQLVLIPVFGLTGIVMWRTDGTLLSWFVHVAAFAAAAPLLVAHLYLALVHRSTRKGLPGAFSGRVGRAWAQEHYPRWVVEHDAREDHAAREAEVAERVRLLLEREAEDAGRG